MLKYLKRLHSVKLYTSGNHIQFNESTGNSSLQVHLLVQILNILCKVQVLLKMCILGVEMGGCEILILSSNVQRCEGIDTFLINNVHELDDLDVQCVHLEIFLAACTQIFIKPSH